MPVLLGRPQEQEARAQEMMYLRSHPRRRWSGSSTPSKKGYVFFTMDADFWQIPFDEEFFCILQRSGLRRGAVTASNRCRSEAAQREVWQAYRRAEVRGLGGGGGFRKILHCPIILSPPGRYQYGGAHG